MSGQLNNSVLTAFTILEMFSETRPSITTQDVSRELDLNPVTAYRFLRSLEVAGALVSPQRGQYRLGLALADLGERATASNTIVGLVQPYLNDLATTLEETALATMNRYGRMTIIAKARSSRPYAMHMDVGTELEAHCTANGKLWLAGLSSGEFEQYLAMSERRRFTPQTLVDADALRREIDKVRQEGFAICSGEREEEISAVGVPVLTKRGKMLAGISVFGPNSHFTSEFIEHSLTVLRSTARHIERSLYGEETREPGGGDKRVAASGAR